MSDTSFSTRSARRVMSSRLPNGVATTYSAGCKALVIGRERWAQHHPTKCLLRWNKGQGTLPLYEYQCKKCAHKFEKIQLFSDAPIKKCPECGGAVEKLISRSAVQFKGTGWYATDYAKKSDGGGSSAKSSGEGSSADSATSKDAKASEPSGESSDSKEAKVKPKAESLSKKS